MSALWTLDAISTAIRAERVGALPAELSGISIDSRTLARAMRSSPFREKIATATISSTMR